MKKNPHIPFDQKRPADHQLVLPSLLDSLNQIDQLTEKLSEQMEFSEDDRDNIAIAVTEVANNAIMHGNKLDYDKNITISFYQDNDRLTIYIKDEGRGFNPKELGNPLEPSNILKETGRGIFILRSLMDDVQFYTNSTGTEVKIVKMIRK